LRWVRDQTLNHCGLEGICEEKIKFSLYSSELTPKFRKLKPPQIQTYFAELVKMGKGEIVGHGRHAKFRAFTDDELTANLPAQAAN
jgi:hypothetical protein